MNFRRLKRLAFRNLPLLCIPVALMVFGGRGLVSAAAEPVSNSTSAVELKLDDYLQLVLERNEALQAQVLEAESDRLKARGEWGAFEPSLATAITRVINKRTNNVQEAAASGGQFFFSERNTIYDAGLESMIPTGAKIRLGYTLSDLVNNVNPFGGFLSTTNNQFIQQYQTFVGATLSQPLLKNAGVGVNMAGIRIAGMDSEIGFQQYRRQLMLTISQAQAAYWNLYFAQEQLRFFDESVSVAESILSDNREKLKAGTASELDVLEAQSGLAFRRTKQNEAKQSFYEAQDRLRTLYGASPVENERAVRAADIPSATTVAFSYSNSFQQTFELNPDYLIQRKKVEEQELRLKVARNQLLPELNAKGAYGYNGLGQTPGSSWDVASSQEFPSWSLGLELRIPLAGGIKARNDYSAARLTLQESIINLNSLQTQIANALNSSMQKARSWQDTIQSYQTVVQFNEDLLKTQLARFNVGRVDGQKVLEVEAALFEARQNLAQALVQYQRSLIEIQLVGGSILKNRNLDLTRDELRRRTFALLKSQPPATRPFQPVYDPQSIISPN
jgi:outer membrane protein TolC